MFLGDSGSLLLGTLIAIYTFYILGDSYVFKTGFDVNKTIFSIMILLYPLFDLLRVFIIRISDKKSPFHPDKNHIHHILINKGFSVIKTIFIIEICYIFLFSILFFKQFFYCCFLYSVLFISYCVCNINCDICFVQEI